MQHFDMQAIQNKLLDKTGEKNSMSDLAILAQKYSKIVTQQEIFGNQSTTLFFKTKSILWHFLLFFTFLCALKDLQPKRKK